MKAGWGLTPLAVLQALLGLRVAWRLVRTAGGPRIPVVDRLARCSGRVAVVVPVLNERARLAPCLDGLLAQGPEVAAILVVDGGSTDDTPALVARYAAQDARVRLLAASPVPADWNGKPWGLQVGWEHVPSDATWVLTLDADVRPAPRLARSLLAFAERTGLRALSVATRQVLGTLGEGLAHPALLATLVYRYGIPGGVARGVQGVQANGQCMLVHRDLLRAVDGFRVAKGSRCEDVTLARALVAMGERVGFFEADGLVWTRMYEGWRETWCNWPRSLPMRDRLAGPATVLGWLEVALVQALPLPLCLLLSVTGDRAPGPRAVNGALAALRLGVLVGTTRAYRPRPWTYWLSPLCDVPAAVALWRSALGRRHVWRGRMLLAEERA